MKTPHPQVTNVVRVTDSLETFDVVERPLDWLAAKHANVSVAYCHAVSVDDGAGVVTCDGAGVLAGAPRITAVVSANPLSRAASQTVAVCRSIGCACAQGRGRRLSRRTRACWACGTDR